MHFESEQWRYLAPFKRYPCVILERGQPWNDYGYVTRFTAYYFPKADEEIHLGVVKILQRGHQRTELRSEFSQLDDGFCSLGQELEFYKRVSELGPSVAAELLQGLRDVVFTPSLQEDFKDEPAYTRSLLRASSALRALRTAGTLFGQRGEAPRSFLSYTRQLEGFDAPHQLEIEFRAQGEWLGRAVALIGRNGTGKTALLGRLAHALSGLSEEEAAALRPERLPVSQVIAISYSAFDTFGRPRSQSRMGVSYVYCGLRDATDRLNLKWAMGMFKAALEDIWGQQRWQHWTRLLRDSGVLEEFPLAEQITADPESLAAWIPKQSSGHKLVLLILARVFGSIREKSVLLFDEPETHLHPRLLSGLMRLLHMLLHQFDSYAILATHSPIVLQEIAARDIRILEREDDVPSIFQYPGESFGENLTEIVNTAFGVDEKSKNYFRILRELVKAQRGREGVRALFDKGMNLNARMALHALTAEREVHDDEEP